MSENRTIDPLAERDYFPPDGEAPKPYPHDALVRAWLDGKTIQYLVRGIWYDMDGPGKVDKMPHFYREGTEYRIKPVAMRYRVGLQMVGSNRPHIFAVDNIEQERVMSGRSTFIRWISDWTEVVL